MKLNTSIKVQELLAIIGLQSFAAICKGNKMTSLNPTELYNAIPEVPLAGARFDFTDVEHQYILVRCGRGELFNNTGERVAEFYLISVLQQNDENAPPSGLSALLQGAGLDPSAGTETHNLGAFVCKDVRNALNSFDSIMETLGEQDNLTLTKNLHGMDPYPSAE
jgi:hypothetical protein